MARIVGATAGFFFDQRKPKIDGSCPVKLRITYQRKTKLFGLDVALTPAQWSQLCASTTRRDARLRDETVSLARWKLYGQDEKKGHEGFLPRAERIIRELPEFSFSAFESAYFHIPAPDEKHAFGSDVYEAFAWHIARTRAEGRERSAQLDEAACTSLSKFQPQLTFRQVTPSWLHGYEQWMSQHGKSATTIGMYLRGLRTLYNVAIDKGVVPAALYPFTKRKGYQVPTGRNVKRALSAEEVQAIADYSTPTGSALERARDLWLFCYLGNGMNLIDLCLLQWKNIEGARLVYTRNKTKRSTRTHPKPIQVSLHPRALTIIDQWSNPDRSRTAFIFPILPPDPTPAVLVNIVEELARVMNKYTKRIAKELGIDKPVTTYYARHSFAMAMRRNGASNEYIGDALGHSSLATTENYLDGFDDPTREQYSALLLK